MAGSINIPAYSDALVVLGTAGIVVPLVRKWGLSSVLGYLGAGALLGPYGLGSLIGKLPFLYWFTIVEPQHVSGIADLGVVFLLFLIGLELSYERLMTMRRLVFGLGGLQIVTSTVLLAAVLAATGQKAAVAVVLGASLALSSTAIVLDLLSAQGRMRTSTGRASFSILLAQDLAVVPILMFVSILGANSGGSIWMTVAMALLHAVAAVAIIALIGRALLRPLFRLVAGTKSNELFIAAILFVIVATGLIAALANLSMSLGAFVAGLLLAETEFRKAIEATIEPFKGLLLGIFFFSVGMEIDPRELAREPIWLLASVIGLVGLKAIVIAALARLYRLSWPSAVETALLLGPGGEFAFVSIGLASSLGVLAADKAHFWLAVTALSMALIPMMATVARKLRPLLETAKPPDPSLMLQPAAQERHAIVVGYGRVGRVVCELLDQHRVPYIVSDLDAGTVTHERRQGREVFFGDATSSEYLQVCGIAQAAAVIITINDMKTIGTVIANVRRLRPDILIVSRARDAEHARHLYKEGVSDAVPETIEASLQLSEAALVALGVPVGPVIASIHERRDVFRAELQKAAAAAGLAAVRPVRAKSRG